MVRRRRWGVEFKLTAQPAVTRSMTTALQDLHLRHLFVVHAEKAALIKLTQNAALAAPSSVHWEVGNAFSAMMRRGRLTRELSTRALEIYESIPIRFVDVDLSASLVVASEHRLYAYDAYLLECARARRAPLLTLDRTLARVAAKMTIDVLEVRENVQVLGSATESGCSSRRGCNHWRGTDQPSRWTQLCGSASQNSAVSSRRTRNRRRYDRYGDRQDDPRQPTTQSLMTNLENSPHPGEFSS